MLCLAATQCAHTQIYTVWERVNVHIETTKHPSSALCGNNRRKNYLCDNCACVKVYDFSSAQKSVRGELKSEQSRKLAKFDFLFA